MLLKTTGIGGGGIGIGWEVFLGAAFLLLELADFGFSFLSVEIFFVAGSGAICPSGCFFLYCFGAA
jgi:hypothetical protein